MTYAFLITSKSHTYIFGESIFNGLLSALACSPESCLVQYFSVKEYV